jgi:hypothetical protein
MRQNGHGALTLEDARTWIEETGLCLFLPKRPFSSSVAPSFVEAIAGKRDATPDQTHIALAEELLVRLENDGVAVRLNLLGQPGEQPDFVVASWVLPYVYALRGDRDWRRSPQLTGSRQVSQLAIQAYKLLEEGDSTIATLKHTLGREVTEVAVLRAITELWQQLRIIPTFSAPGQPAHWQLLRSRYQKAIAEGASTSQVTAISVLASIYLQAVIAASMEDVELFLAPLTARSKVREVLRGLVATRQVHTISLGHAPHFYVAGTLPEFSAPATLYASSSMSSAAYFLRAREQEEEALELELPSPTGSALAQPAETHKSNGNGVPAAPRPHFSRPAAHVRDRKPAQPSTGARPSARSGSRPVRRASSSEVRPAKARPAGATWKPKAPATTNGNRNGSHATSGNGARTAASNGTSSTRNAKTPSPTWSQRNGHANGAKSAAKPGSAARTGSLARGSSATRNGSASRKEVRPSARPSNNSRKPALTAGTKAGNSTRFGFSARPKQETKKRG